MKLVNHLILFIFTAGLGNLIWFMFFRNPQPQSFSIGSFDNKPLSDDDVQDLMFRNAPPEYEIVIRNSKDAEFVRLSDELSQWTNSMHSTTLDRLSQLGYELPFPDEIDNDSRAVAVQNQIIDEFYPTGIMIVNQIAPYYNRPEFVFSQIPEHNNRYSNEQLKDWYQSIFTQLITVIEEYNVLLEEWNGMMFDVANTQALADKATMELEMSNLNLQMNAASLQEQRRHNLAMEETINQNNQSQKSQSKSGSILGGAARGLGKLAAANYNMVQNQRNQTVTYRCWKCNQVKSYKTITSKARCCGRSMTRI